MKQTVFSKLKRSLALALVLISLVSLPGLVALAADTASALTPEPPEWEASLPAELTGELRPDVVSVARSQKDYAMPEEEGAPNRYAAWAGAEELERYDAAFAAFCLHYAGLADLTALLGDDAEHPVYDAAAWYKALSDAQLLRSAASVQPGDLIFVDVVEPAETEEPVETEEPIETEEPVETEEPAEVEEPVETEEPAETEEPVETEEPAEVEEPIEVEEPAEVEEPVKAEEPVEVAEESAEIAAPAEAVYLTEELEQPAEEPAVQIPAPTGEVRVGVVVAVEGGVKYLFVNEKGAVEEAVTDLSAAVLACFDPESIAPAAETAETEEPVELAEQTIEATILTEEPAVPSVRKAASRNDRVIQVSESVTLSGKLPKNAIVEAAPVTVEVESENVLVAYDIKIYVNENQRAKGKTWQPADSKIHVTFQNSALADQADELDVYHLASAEAVAEHVAAVNAEDAAVTFDAGSFSIYAVGSPRRITYELYLDQAFTEPYNFKIQGEEGLVETNRIIVKQGDVLQFPQNPVSDAGPFRGWYTAENVEVAPGEVGTINSDQTIRLYARFGDVFYAIFHEDKAQRDVGGVMQDYWPVSETVKLLVESGSATINVDDYEPKIDDPNKIFKGWSTVKDALTPNVTGAQTITGNTHYYPVYAAAHTVYFYTSYSGSGATYINPVRVEHNHPLSEAEPKTTTGVRIEPTWAGHSFLGWCLLPYYDGSAELSLNGDPAQGADPAKTCSHDESCTHSAFRDWSAQTTPVEEEMTLYAVWSRNPSAKFTVIIKQESLKDDAGMAATDKQYDIVSIHTYTGSTNDDNIVTAAPDGDNVSVTYQDGSGNSQAASLTAPESVGFEFARADASNVEPDGSTIINVYYDRKVYTIVVKAGANYDRSQLTSGFELVEKPTGEVYGKFGEDDYRQLEYKFWGWRYEDQIWPYVGTSSPKVYRGRLTLLSSNVYNNDTVAEGTVGYASRTDSMSYLGYYPIIRPTVTAYYAWFEAGTRNRYTGEDFYQLKAADTVAVYSDLYEKPTGLDTSVSYFYKQGYVTNTLNGAGYRFYTALDGKYLMAKEQYPFSYNGSNEMYDVVGSTRQRYNFAANNAAVQSANQNMKALLTFNFSTVLGDVGAYTIWEVEDTSVDYYSYNRTKRGTAVVPYRVSYTEYTSNLVGTTLTVFANSKTLEANTSTNYYKLAVPASGESITGAYEDYVRSYEAKITAGDASAKPIYGTTLRLTASGVAVSGASNEKIANYAISRYQSVLRGNSAGNVDWTDTKIQSNNRVSFIHQYSTSYPEETYNLYSKNGTQASATNYYTLDMLFTPLAKEVVFYAGGAGSAEVGQISVPIDWSISNFSSTNYPSSAYNPRYEFEQNYDFEIGTPIEDLAAEHSWVADYLATSEGSAKAGKTFQGWYLDPEYSVEFSSRMPIVGMTVLYAKWDEPWFIATVDPRGGALGGSVSGSTWFWIERGDKIQRYQLRRDYVEWNTGDPAPADGKYYYYFYNDRANNYRNRSGDGSENSVARAAGYVLTTGLTEVETGVWQDPATGYYYCNVDSSKRYVRNPGMWQFEGWYFTNDQGKNVEYSFGAVTGDVSIWAEWKDIFIYTLTYELNGGTELVDANLGTIYTAGSGNAYDEAFINTATIVISCSAKWSTESEEKQFLGWKIEGDSSGTIYQLGDTVPVKTEYAQSNKIKLVAQYGLLDTVKLTYDANGGTGTLTDLASLAQDQQEASGNMLYNIEKNANVKTSYGMGFTKDGFTLAGWNSSQTEAAAGNVEYELGEEIFMDTDHTLYAVWKEGLLTVRVYLDGESIGTKVLTATEPIEDTSHNVLSFASGISEPNIRSYVRTALNLGAVLGDAEWEKTVVNGNDAKFVKVVGSDWQYSASASGSGTYTSIGEATLDIHYSGGYELTVTVDCAEDDTAEFTYVVKNTDTDAVLATFTGMKHGESNTVRVPNGAPISVEQTAASPNPFKVEYRVNKTGESTGDYTEAKLATIAAMDEAKTVTFKITYTVPAPTGYTAQEAPFYPLLCCGLVLLLTAVLIPVHARRRGRHEA